MTRNVRCGLIQCSNPINDEQRPVAEIQKAMLDRHLPFIDEAGKRGVQILCLQEIFNGPYFCPSQDQRWYDAAEPVPGPMTSLMAQYAKKYEMVIVVPVYERESAGVYYNTAAVIDADGTPRTQLRRDELAPYINSPCADDSCVQIELDLDALRASGGRARGVATVRPDVVSTASKRVGHRVAM